MGTTTSQINTIKPPIDTGGDVSIHTANNTHGYGAILPPVSSASDNQGYLFPRLFSFPSKWDVRLESCAPYFPAWDQGDRGTCTAQTAGALFKCELLRRKVPDPPDPSTLWNYYWSRGGTISEAPYGDNGSSTHEALNVMSLLGVATEKSWTYDRPIDEIPDLPSLEVASNYSVVDYHPLRSTLENLKACLVSGKPFGFSFVVFQSINDWLRNRPDQITTKFVLPEPGEQEPVVGGHAVTAVAYDDSIAGGVFLIRNSWGPKWGLDGHFYMSYTTVTTDQICRDFHFIHEVCIPSDTPNQNQRCIKECPADDLTEQVCNELGYVPPVTLVKDLPGHNFG